MAKLIGTAGHVDHGKTTLIQALTGIDADRLPEEKRRGMTIDIGFAFVDLPKVGRVSIVDVPGHERFLTNMLAGALAIDVALLCVAADEGVKPQTEEHFQILQVLPVDSVIVALTRVDLAEPEQLEIAKAQVEELLEPTRFKGSVIVEVSAVTGSGLENLKSKLVDALDKPAREEAGPWYLPIDRAFTLKGLGVVVTGTLAGGPVRAGAEAVLQPGGAQCRVRTIHAHSESVESSEPGKRTALNLGGVKLEDVHRGMAIGELGSLLETRILDAEVNWVAEHKHGMRIRLAVGADEAVGRLFLSLDRPNIAQLRLEKPVACTTGQPVVIRAYSPPTLLGGGLVAVPQARLRRRGEEVTARTPQGSDREGILRLLDTAPKGISTAELSRQLGRPERALGPELDKLFADKSVHGFAGMWLSPAAYVEAVRSLESALASIHEKYPTHAGIPKDRVVARSGLGWEGKPLDRLLAEMAAQDRVVISGNLLRDPRFKPQLSQKQQDFMDRVAATLDEAGANVPSPLDIARLLGAPPQAVEEILRLGVKSGRIVRVYEGIFYTERGLETLRSKIAEMYKGRRFAASDLRDSLGTSRKYAIPLLEYFDSVRFTLRVGDNRVVRTDP